MDAISTPPSTKGPPPAATSFANRPADIPVPVDEPAHAARLKVFVSYSRSNLEFVDRFVAALERHELQILVDRRDVPLIVEFQNELLDLIRQADTVVFIVSKASISSRWCEWEIAQVETLGKRLAPVVIELVDNDKIPATIRKINYAFFTGENADGRAFEARISDLAHALKTDRAWIKEHTRIGELARRWQERRCLKTMLLRGGELEAAEAWIAKQPLEAPPLTDLHRTYIVASRRAATQRQRSLIAGSMAAAIIALTLAGIAIWQRGVAQRNEQLAKRESRGSTAQALAAQANEFRSSMPQPSLLLAAQAVHTTASYGEPIVPAAEQALRDSLAGLGGIVLRGHTGPVELVATSPDSRWVVTGSEDRTARVWDLEASDPSSTAVTLSGHAKEVDHLAISGDDKWVITADSEGPLLVWELPAHAPATPRYVLPRAAGDRLNALVTSPDGRWIIASSKSGISFWDLKSSDPTKAVTIAMEDPGALTIAPDGRSLVTSHLDGTARVWALPPPPRPAPQRVFAPTDDSFTARPITVVTVTNDGRWLGTGNVGGTVRLWDLANPQRTTPVARLPAEGIPWHDTDFRIVSLSINPDGKIAALQNDGVVRLYQLNKDNTVAGPRQFREQWEIGDGAMSADGRWLMIAGERGDTRLLSLAADGSGVLLRGHESYVNSVAFTRDNKWAITGSSDDTARLWRMQPVSTSAQPVTLPVISEGSHNNLGIAAISADGRSIIAASEYDDIRMLQLPAASPESWTRLQPKIIKAGLTRVASFGWSNQSFVTAEGLGEVFLWSPDGTGNTPTQRRVGKLDSGVASLTLSHDQRFVAAGATRGGVWLWDLTNKDSATNPQKFDDIYGVTAVAISPDNRWIAIGGDTVMVRLVADAAFKRQISDREIGLQVISAAFPADAQRLAVAFGQEPNSTTFVGGHAMAPQGVVKIWQVGAQDVSGNPLVLRVSGASLTSIAFSPGGRWLVAGGSDGSVRLWDLRSAASPEQFVVLRGDNKRVVAVAITEDEKFVVAYSSDETVRIWRLQIPDLLELARRHLGRNLSAREWAAFQPGRVIDPVFPELNGVQDGATARRSNMDAIPIEVR